MSDRNIVRWENDQHTPRVEHLSAIASACGVGVEDFFQGAAEDDEESSMPLHRDMLEALHEALGVALGKTKVNA